MIFFLCVPHGPDEQGTKPALVLECLIIFLSWPTLILYFAHLIDPAERELMSPGIHQELPLAQLVPESSLILFSQPCFLAQLSQERIKHPVCSKSGKFSHSDGLQRGQNPPLSVLQNPYTHTFEPSLTMAFPGFICLSENWLYVEVLSSFWEKEQERVMFSCPGRFLHPPVSFGMKSWSWDWCWKVTIFFHYVHRNALGL